MARRGRYRLVRSILDHRVVEFVYQGCRRTAALTCSVCMRRASRSPLGTQTAGASHSGEIPGCRTFITTGIGEVDVTDRGFSGPRFDFKPYGYAMLDIFARA